LRDVDKKFFEKYFHLNISGHVSLPFQFSFSLLDHDGNLPVVLHEVSEALAELDVFLGRVGFRGLDVIEVSSEDDEHVVLGDVVLDLGLEESLGSVVHDLVTQLGLGDVFSKLLDARPSGALGTVQVDQLVTLVLGSQHCWIFLQKLLHHRELSSEQGILLHVHLVGVHLQEVQVEAGHNLQKTREGIFDLIFSEETGDDAPSGGPGEPDLAVDDDGSVELCSCQSPGEKIVVIVCGRARVADRNAVEGETCNQCCLSVENCHHERESARTWIFRLQSVNNFFLTEDLLGGHLLLGLGAGLVLQLAAIGLSAGLDLVGELQLLALHHLPGDLAQLGILSDLEDYQDKVESKRNQS